ncbi:MAG: PP2C family protein-serine/threonine phosphatase [Gammaproteobacteria bacterium]
MSSSAPKTTTPVTPTASAGGSSSPIPKLDEKITFEKGEKKNESTQLVETVQMGQGILLSKDGSVYGRREDHRAGQDRMLVASMPDVGSLVDPSKQIPEILRSSFAIVQQRIKDTIGEEAQFAGTTACVAMTYNLPNGKHGVSVASVGDSSAYAVDGKGGHALTVAHKLSNPGELERCKKAAPSYKYTGENVRVGGRLGIMVSRALGDTNFEKDGLIHEPEIQTLPLQGPGKLVMGCDGVCEDTHMKVQDVHLAVQKEKTNQKVVERLWKTTKSLGRTDVYSDDLTLLCADVTNPMIYCVFDGHGGSGQYGVAIVADFVKTNLPQIIQEETLKIVRQQTLLATSPSTIISSATLAASLTTTAPPQPAPAVAAAPTASISTSAAFRPAPSTAAAPSPTAVSTVASATTTTPPPASPKMGAVKPASQEIQVLDEFEKFLKDLRDVKVENGENKEEARNTFWNDNKPRFIELLNAADSEDLKKIKNRIENKPGLQGTKYPQMLLEELDRVILSKGNAIASSAVPAAASTTTATTQPATPPAALFIPTPASVPRSAKTSGPAARPPSPSPQRPSSPRPTAATSSGGGSSSSAAPRPSSPVTPPSAPRATSGQGSGSTAPAVVSKPYDPSLTVDSTQFSAIASRFVGIDDEFVKALRGGGVFTAHKNVNALEWSDGFYPEFAREAKHGTEVITIEDSDLIKKLIARCKDLQELKQEKPQGNADPAVKKQNRENEDFAQKECDKALGIEGAYESIKSAYVQNIKDAFITNHLLSIFLASFDKFGISAKVEPQFSTLNYRNREGQIVIDFELKNLKFILEGVQGTQLSQHRWEKFFQSGGDIKGSLVYTPEGFELEKLEFNRQDIHDFVVGTPKKPTEVLAWVNEQLKASQQQELSISEEVRINADYAHELANFGQKLHGFDDRLLSLPDLTALSNTYDIVGEQLVQVGVDQNNNPRLEKVSDMQALLWEYPDPAKIRLEDFEYVRTLQKEKIYPKLSGEYTSDLAQGGKPACLNEQEKYPVKVCIFLAHEVRRKLINLAEEFRQLLIKLENLTPESLADYGQRLHKLKDEASDLSFIDHISPQHQTQYKELIDLGKNLNDLTARLYNTYLDREISLLRVKQNFSAALLECCGPRQKKDLTYFAELLRYWHLSEQPDHQKSYPFVVRNFVKFVIDGLGANPPNDKAGFPGAFGGLFGTNAMEDVKLLKDLMQDLDFHSAGIDVQKQPFWSSILNRYDISSKLKLLTELHASPLVKGSSEQRLATLLQENIIGTIRISITDDLLLKLKRLDPTASITATTTPVPSASKKLEELSNEELNFLSNVGRELDRRYALNIEAYEKGNKLPPELVFEVKQQYNDCDQLNARGGLRDQLRAELLDREQEKRNPNFRQEREEAFQTEVRAVKSNPVYYPMLSESKQTNEQSQPVLVQPEELILLNAIESPTNQLPLSVRRQAFQCLRVILDGRLPFYGIGKIVSQYLDPATRPSVNLVELQANLKPKASFWQDVWSSVTSPGSFFKNFRDKRAERKTREQLLHHIEVLQSMLSPPEGATSSTTLIPAISAASVGMTVVSSTASSAPAAISKTTAPTAQAVTTAASTTTTPVSSESAASASAAPAQTTASAASSSTTTATAATPTSSSYSQIITAAGSSGRTEAPSTVGAESSVTSRASSPANQNTPIWPQGEGGNKPPSADAPKETLVPPT